MRLAAFQVEKQLFSSVGQLCDDGPHGRAVTLKSLESDTVSKQNLSLMLRTLIKIFDQIKDI